LGADNFNINLRVESDPYWIIKPRDVYAREGDTFEFLCHTDSKPPPDNIQWFINGVPLQDPSVQHNPHRRIIKNRMVMQNVTKLDMAVYQCNVSNIHGYVFANFFVSVTCK
jgi:neuronal cell adhesion protein